MLFAKKNTSYIFLLLFIHTIRGFNLLINSQFWAEDGTIFYQDAYNNGMSSLFVSYQGYFHTIQRLISLITSKLSLIYAPFIFNIVAFFIHFLPVFLIFSKRTDKIFTDREDKFIFSLIYILCPISYETYITLTNIQWYLPVYILIYLMADRSSNNIINVAEYILLLLSGLTGPFIIFILPIYLLLIGLKKLQNNKIHIFIMLFAFLIQLFAIINNGSPGNSSHNLGLFIKIFSVKIFWNSLVGIEGQRFLFFGTEFYSNPALLLVGFLLWLLVFVLSFQTKNLVIITFNSFSFLVALSGFYKILSAMETAPWDGMFGARYALNSSLVFIYSLFYLFKYNYIKSPFYYLFGLTFILCLILAIPFDFRNTRMNDFNWRGHAERFQSAIPGDTVVLPINPGGWNLTLVKK